MKRSLSVSVCCVLALWAVGLLAMPGRPAMAKPQVVQTLFATEDVVVATEVVDAPRDDQADATGRIQSAIDQAAAAGGGVVFLPAGRYRLDGRLVLKEGVTLRGDWAPPSRESIGKGTLLMIYGDRGSAEAPPTITMERGSGMREVTIWHPEQSPTAVVPYPWTLRTCTKMTGNNTTVMNVTLVNPYQGVCIGPEWNELHTLRNVYATPLKTGVAIDTTTDIGRLIDVRFSPKWWEESGLPGAPAAPAEREALRAWLLKEGTGVDMGRSDWEYLYNVNVEGYAVGLVIRPGKQGTTNAVLFGGALTDCGTALRLDALNGVGLSATGCRLEGREHAIHARKSFTTVTQLNACDLGGGVLLEGSGLLTFQGCRFASWGEAAVDARAGSVSLLGCEFAQPGTHVRLAKQVQRARVLGNRFRGKPGIESESTGDVQVAHRGMGFARPNTAPHTAAPHPRPVGKALFVVTDFGADPKGEDNTAAFTAAFAAARKAGGGTVYVPGGNYRFAGELTVPTGVELRGVFDVPHHTVSGGSVLMPLAGKGNADGKPFVSLERGSGARGITLWYPEQNLQEPAAYPWAIRSLGPGCWLLDVTLGNAYQGVDFWTHPSDGHVIRYLAGGLLKRGLFISKCRGDGWVEDVQFNPHYTARIHASLPRPKYQSDPFGGLIDYQRANLEGIVFGRCEREHVRGTFLYAAYDGIAFRDDGGGTNARVIEHGTDTGSRCAVMEATGTKGVEFINAQLVPLGKHEVGAIVVPPAFRGKVAFFNSQIWAGNTSGIIEGQGEVLIQQLNTVSGGFRVEGGRCVLENVTFARDLQPHVAVGAGVREARLTANLSKDCFRIENAAGERCVARASSLSLPPVEGTAVLRTGWEEGEPQGIADTIAVTGGGIRTVSKPECRPVETAAHTGKRALRVAGNADDPSYSFAYFKLFAEPLVINPDSVLSYWIKPLNERGRSIGIDLTFADGGTLRDSGARTSAGKGVHAGGQHDAPVGEWQQVTIPLGRHFPGRTISSIMVGYDSRSGGGAFEALIDDLALESSDGDLPWRVAATPAGGTCPVGGRVDLKSLEGAAIRYTLDGTPPNANSPRYEKPIVLDKPGLWEVRYSSESADGRLSSRVFGALYEVSGKR